MKTDDLVHLLSTGEIPVARGISFRRFSAAILVALIGALLLLLALYGIRPDIGVVSRTPLFWAKVTFPLLLAMGAWSALIRLSRPASRVRAVGIMTLLPVLAVWVGGALVLFAAAPQDRWVVLLGHTWRSCPFNIFLLSLPGLFAILWAVGGLAPTRLRSAGAAAGLLAGSIGTLVYCLHCPEMSPAFWGIWYLLGLLLPTATGALLGRVLLRW